MRTKRKKELQENQAIAKERIIILFQQAEEQFAKDNELSDRYVEIARKIAMKCNVRIPREFKRRFCKHCYRYLVPSVNCRVRLHKQKVVYYCLNCKKFMRFPYHKRG